MKKQYDTPEAKKIEFNYEENVVASTKMKWNSAAPLESATNSAKCYGYNPPPSDCILVPAE